MATAHVHHRHARHAALLLAASAALLTAAGCAGTTTDLAPSRVGAGSSAPGSVAGSTGTVAAKSSGAAPARTAATAVLVAAAAPACGNDDLAIGFGYGTQSLPLQAQGIVFTNVGGHACTLRGYPGAAVLVDGRTVNAVRVLNGFRGDLPKLSSTPLVTLAPGAGSYAVLEWLVGSGSGCYPAGAGTLEVTAPDDSRTRTLSTGFHTGPGGACSALEINPVVPGYFGVPVGVPARN